MKCVAIDVANGKSMCTIIDNNGEIFLEPKEYKHNLIGLNELLNTIKGLNDKDIHIIMESTSIYHLPIERFFKDNTSYEVIILNPLISKANKINLRKTKTDIQDCFNLTDIFFNNKYNEQRSINVLERELQYLSRQYFFIEDNSTQLKNRFKQILYLCFPEYKDFFKTTIYEQNALKFIYNYPHPDYLKNKRIDVLARQLSNNGLPNIVSRYKNKLHSFKLDISNSIPCVDKNSYLIDNLKQIIEVLIEVEIQRKLVLNKLIELAKLDRQFNLFNSVVGVGETSAALLVAELHDLRRFPGIKQLIAYCGTDPGIKQSGNSINTSLSISKRGNKYTRKILFNIITNILRVNSKKNVVYDRTIYNYYNKKRSEGKHHYAAIIACGNKLLSILYTLSIKNEIYIPNYKQN